MSKYPEVYKVIGSPGSGKTTRVVGNPDLELDGLFIENGDQYPLEQQMLVTYTKAGVEEAADRLGRMLDAPKYKINNRVTTIHSQCFGLLGLSREDVVTSYDKKQFCSKFDLAYGWSDDSDDIMSSEDTKPGNLLFEMYGWLQSNRIKLSDWEDCPMEWSGEDDPQFLMGMWEKYKAENGLVGFGDMIERVVQQGMAELGDLGWVTEEPTIENTKRLLEEANENFLHDPNRIRGMGPFIDTHVLYVDEVQDLTRLQWEWYLLQKLVCEKVYLGGDDDQCIYGWSGADPEFMLNEEGDFEVLERTYRIPEEIWTICKQSIEQVDERQDKEVIPDGDGGEVVELKRPGPYDIKDHILESDDVFFLFRARYMIDDYAEKLSKLGIPYRNNSTFDMWDGDLLEIRNGFRALKEGNKLSNDEVEAFKSNLPQKCFRGGGGNRDAKSAALDKLKGITPEKFHNMFSLRPVDGPNTISLDAFCDATQDYSEGLNYYQCQGLKGNIKNNNEHLSPENLTLGTIHSSKGKEADTVIVATDTTQTIVDEMNEEIMHEPEKVISDAERRVYYVAMSRASRKLVLAEGVVNPDCAIPIEHIKGEEVKHGQTRLDHQY